MDATEKATLADLAAREAIRRLISAYCDAVMRGDADAAAALFAPEARLQIADSPEILGRDAIAAGMRATFSAIDIVHMHCDTGLIEVTGDTAQAQLGVHEVARKPDSDSLSLVFGCYEDRYVRLTVGWRFAARRYSLRLRALIPADKLQQGPEFIPIFGFYP
jgi:uncharacterized protein (TIGR02246 family)